MVTKNQKEKAELLLKLHKDPKILVLFNAWDPGSARLIEACGFPVIATTSAGIAASLGYPDCQVIPFEEMAKAIAKIVSNVTLPVTADSEGGYGETLDEIISCIQRLIATGIVGINIEDSYHLKAPLIDQSEFSERIQAIRNRARSLGLHLVINARTDVFLAAIGDPKDRLEQSIQRGNLYREAGADCIFIPGVWEKKAIATLVKEIDAPINILANPTNDTALPPSIQELEELGVARVSLGSSPMKATLSVTKKIAQELLEKGSYNALTNALGPLPEATKAYAMATGN